MIRRLIVLAVVVGGLSVGDVALRNVAENQVDNRAEAELPAGTDVSTDIRSFPFVARLLIGGDVGRVSVHLEPLTAGPVTFAAVDVRLDGVKVDRDRLLSKRRVELTRISRGTVAALLTASELSRQFGVPIEISGGQVSVTVGGRSVAARIEVRGGRLVLRRDPLPAVSFVIPESDFIPCAADATVLAGRIRVTCSFDDIPPGLLRAANVGVEGP